MGQPITQFKGEYAWLSNFAKVDITLGGITYPSVEHAYMSAKCDDPEWKAFCKNTESAGQVKRESYKQKLVDDWETKKILVMTECLRQKFAQEPFRSKLIDTWGSELSEGNMHGDDFWGVCLKTGQGKNVLGTLIMAIREIIFDELDS